MASANRTQQRSGNAPLKNGAAPAPEEKHRHPAAQGNVRVEEVGVQTGVTAGDEGCAEHYYQRFVQTETAEEEHDFSMLKDAVLGAVILTPRFRSPFKRRFP